MHIVLTGRNATKRILDMADLVTEMKELKHPYNVGIRAQAGIEY
jgi:cob(I)alamin adenosyltransferase